MKNKGIVSVIIPAYNSEKYIDDCVASVINQTYPHWEIVIINDGSTDKTAEICEQYSRSNKNIMTIHQENSGVSSARNKGIENSSGEYILFLDSDDRLTTDCIEVLLNGFNEGNVDIVSGIVSDKNCAKKEHIHVWQGEDGLRNSLSDNPFAYSACGKIYSRGIIGDTRFRTDIRINEDSLFVFQIMCKKPTFVCTNQEIYVYNAVTGSASRSDFSEKYFDILRVSDIKYEIVRNRFPMLLDLAENMRIKANLNILRLLATRTNGEYKDLEDRAIKYICDNKKYYISIKKDDDKFFFIVTHGLYKVYRFLFKVKRSVTGKRHFVHGD